MDNSRVGFTLAEVLLTITIIGVVASSTIPTLITKTNNMKYTTSLKKNLSVLNSALQMNLANTETNTSHTSIIDSGELANWFITGNAAGTGTMRNLNILKWSVNDTEVWLVDGTRLSFVKYNNGAGCTTAEASAFDPRVPSICYVYVDVNGDKPPNQVATAEIPADLYILGIIPGAVIPVVLTDDTDVFPDTDINGDPLYPEYLDSGDTFLHRDNNASFSIMTASN